MDKMDTSKRGRSASLWNWFDRLRWNHRRQIKDSNKIKLDFSPSRRQSTPDEVFLVSCLTLNESPMKRRLSSKRIKRPVSCYTLAFSDELRKNRSYNETHFPSQTTPSSAAAAIDVSIDHKVKVISFTSHHIFRVKIDR